jgi:CelD/BcsL family acetyltransferase involved in cellulose biosynthesis
MQIVCVDPQGDNRWLQLLERYRSDAFHTPAWMSVLRETYDLEVSAYILLNEAGEPLAGLPFGRIADARGERFVTLPFSDYCDPLVSDQDHWRCLVEPLLAEGRPFAIRCLHNSLPLADDRFTQLNKAKWHGLDLRPDADLLWQGLDSSVRRAVRKARQQGVSVQIAQGAEGLRAFFELHLGVRKYKYRLLAQPYRFFQSIWSHFIEQGCGALMLAVYQGEIIGGVLFLEWKDRLYYKFNASNPAWLSLRPNDLLIWEGMNYGRRKGYTLLDFGLSDWDQEGLVRYKRKFATEEKTISFLRYPPSLQVPQNERHVQNLLPQLTNLFTDPAVPDPVTEMAGELLYGLFA